MALLGTFASRLSLGLRDVLPLGRLALPRVLTFPGWRGGDKGPGEGAGGGDGQGDGQPLSLRPTRAGRDPDRYEFKYWVPEPLIEEIVRHCLPYVAADVHDQDKTSGGQVNSSLYFDTPDLAFFHAHIEHCPDRYKLRVRAYGDPPSGKAFFEVKRKINRITLKTRADLPLGQLVPMLDGSYDQLPVLDANSRRHLEHFLYLRTITHAEPVVLVRCRRAAYASIDPAEDIRVTFDRHICFQPWRQLSLDGDPAAWVPIDGFEQHGGAGPHALLELKFPRIAPPWMRDLTEKLEMRRVSNSKYAWAIRTMLEGAHADAQLRELVSRVG